MSDDLFSVRVVVVSALPGGRDLFRKAAAMARTPAEIIEAESEKAAIRSFAANVDLLLIDAALGDQAIARMVAAARGATAPPFTVLLTEPNKTVGAFPTDATATKPVQFLDAKRFLESVSRVLRTCRALVLDDSSTMRSIVRKTLAATRFPFDVSEAAQGGEAIEFACNVDFDTGFVDYDLPGFSGLETMAEIRRLKRDPSFVLITSAQDPAIEMRARSNGVAFLKKPFFPADIEVILCDYYGLSALNPQRVSPPAKGSGDGPRG